MRKILSRFLKRLSVWAIKKHDLKFIVVSGLHGTSITGHILAEMLRPELTIRHQLQRPSWDFSIPLAILGIEDRRYSIIGWIPVLIKAVFLLIFSPMVPSWVILQIGNAKKDIVNYWLSIVQPEVTVFLDSGTSRPWMLKELVPITKRLVVVDDTSSGLAKKYAKNGPIVLSVGKTNDADVLWEKVAITDRGTVIRLKIENNPQEFFAFQKGAFLNDPLIKSICTLAGMGFSSQTIAHNLLVLELDIQDFFI